MNINQYPGFIPALVTSVEMRELANIVKVGDYLNSYDAGPDEDRFRAVMALATDPKVAPHLKAFSDHWKANNVASDDSVEGGPFTWEFGAVNESTLILPGTDDNTVLVIGESMGGSSVWFTDIGSLMDDQIFHLEEFYEAEAALED